MNDLFMVPIINSLSLPSVLKPHWSKFYASLCHCKSTMSYQEFLLETRVGFAMFVAIALIRSMTPSYCMNSSIKRCKLEAFKLN